ncbi:hypothetical protein C2S52_015230 [Perilla frutescens var. hirtella]|nr:hypothetical protein C2S52_015230 [Perilla frutescens var. hirtella]
MDRLEKELVNSDLFGCVQEKHGKYYQKFIKEKLIPVVGNICEPNLGMDSDSARAIMEDVNVIIESAAITTLNERLVFSLYSLFSRFLGYDLLLDTNVNGPLRLMRFSKTCKNLELLVHISTAYVNGEREGIILEKPLIMGENRRNDDVETRPLFRGLDVGDEINLALRSCTATSNYDMTRDMKRLGMERAKFYGWYNTYHLSKAMAEMVIHETRGDIPMLIIRPSVIESCYKQPYPGWIQGNRMFDPIIISYGKGQLPAFLGDPNTPMDIIPLDIVVNTTIAAIAKHGFMGKSELNVYQLASGFVNPLRVLEFFEYIHEYFSSDPLIESESFTRINYYDNLAKIKYFDNFDDFSKYTREEISERLRNAFGVGEKTIQTKIQKQCKAKVTYAEHLSKMYEFLGFFKARFDAGNTQKLLSEMSNDEKMSFAIDVKEINWRKYFQEVHIPGLRKHVLNDKRISI